MEASNETQTQAVAPAKAGVKETGEFLTGVLELGLAVVPVLKDGIQAVPDFMAVVNKYKNDPAFAAKIDEAFKGVQSIPAEVKDLDAAEVAQLIGIAIPYVPKYLEALK